MKFWDTSALTPLILAEPRSRAMRQLMIGDAHCVVSFITPIELQSAVTRRLKTDDAETRQKASQLLSVLDSGWTVLDEYARIATRARRLAAVHALRGADAIQLASALTLLAEGVRLDFVTLDEELAAAARAEGFPVLP